MACVRTGSPSPPVRGREEGVGNTNTGIVGVAQYAWRLGAGGLGEPVRTQTFFFSFGYACCLGAGGRGEPVRTLPLS